MFSIIIPELHFWNNANTAPTAANHRAEKNTASLVRFRNSSQITIAVGIATEECLIRKAATAARAATNTDRVFDDREAVNPASAAKKRAGKSCRTVAAHGNTAGNDRKSSGAMNERLRGNLFDLLQT